MVEEKDILDIRIRLETPADYRIVEELTREAFWGCMDHPTCDGEHLLVHKLRKLPVCVKQLDFVAETDGKIIGHVIYSLAKVITPDGREAEVLNFGPLSVLPEYKKKGIGSALMRHSIAEAMRLGYRAIIFYGHPDYYPRFGFRRAKDYGITAENGDSFDALMAMELYDGALEGISGRFAEDSVYQVDPAEMEEFEKGFPPKEPVRLVPIEMLTDRLLPDIDIKETFAKREIRHIAQLHRYSGAEMLQWEGIDESVLKRINEVLAEYGYSRKLLPSSWILQLAKMNMRIPRCQLMREKAGISLYRVETEGKKYVLKVFAGQEDRREIDNYRLLAKLGVPTLPLVAATQNAILMPDVNDDSEYRLGIEQDMDDVQVARALAGWYKTLHEKGAAWLSGRETAIYDETDVITPDNMEKVARYTGTQENPLWDELARCWEPIRSRIDGMEEQRKADAVLSPLVTLFFASEQESFPDWAKGALAELKNGDILQHLREWLTNW